jgi:bifunctional DNA-binding transcriptional regulator/antitoxin component of YhaV-PrlF toxin-antitoxin module
MREPHGPIRLNKNRQIALPKVLTDHLRLNADDQVYVMRGEDDCSLIVVPVERVTEWMRIGSEVERRHASAAEGEARQDV